MNSKLNFDVCHLKLILNHFEVCSFEPPSRTHQPNCYGVLLLWTRIVVRGTAHFPRLASLDLPCRDRFALKTTGDLKKTLFVYYFCIDPFTSPNIHTVNTMQFWAKLRNFIVALEAILRQFSGSKMKSPIRGRWLQKALCPSSTPRTRYQSYKTQNTVELQRK